MNRRFSKLVLTLFIGPFLQVSAQQLPTPADLLNEHRQAREELKLSLEEQKIDSGISWFVNWSP